MTQKDQPTRRQHYIRPIVTWGYVLLLIYASLYPWTNWHVPDKSWLELFDIKGRWMPRSDFLTNFLVYVPFGILVTISLKSRIRKPWTIPAVAGLALVLSLVLEFAQIFLPRVPSVWDSGMNVLGAAFGGGLAYLSGKQSAYGLKIRQFRYRTFAEGRLADLGLVILGIWGLSVTSPLIPSLSLSAYQASLTAFPSVLTNPGKFSAPLMIQTALSVFVVGFLLNTILKKPHRFWPAFLIFTAIIIGWRFPAADILLTPAHLLGLFLGWLMFKIASRQTLKQQAALAIVAVISAFILSSIYTHAPHPTVNAVVNWLPFDKQIGKVHRFGEILNHSFLFLALSYCFLHLKPQPDNNWGMLGGFLVAVFVLIMEAQASSIRGGTIDITEVIIALGAWTLPWLHPEIKKGPD